MIFLQPLDALRILGEQLHMESCSSFCNTMGVEVDVMSQFIGVRVAVSLVVVEHGNGNLR